MINAQEREECREAALEYLAARPAIAQRAETIWRRLKKENPSYSLDDVKAALEFLCEKKLLKKMTEELGSSIFYQVSADGQLYVERRLGV